MNISPNTRRALIPMVLFVQTLLLGLCASVSKGAVHDTALALALLCGPIIAALTLTGPRPREVALAAIFSFVRRARPYSFRLIRHVEHPKASEYMNELLEKCIDPPASPRDVLAREEAARGLLQHFALTSDRQLINS